jgi:hypothetical protein
LENEACGLGCCDLAIAFQAFLSQHFRKLKLLGLDPEIWLLLSKPSFKIGLGSWELASPFQASFQKAFEKWSFWAWILGSGFGFSNFLFKSFPK